MRAPLSDLREKIAAFRDCVQDSLVSLQNGLNQRAEAANAREVLELLLDTFHVVSKVFFLIFFVCYWHSILVLNCKGSCPN